MAPMKISSHEAGHCVVATMLGYPAGAVVTPTRGRAIYDCHATNPTHRSAMALAGGLGDFFYDQPNGSSEEAHRYIVDGHGCSPSDWQNVATDRAVAWAAFHLAVSILRQHHFALVRVADQLGKFGEINPYEVRALCQKSS